ncbi:MAG: hypothetical protein ACREV4_08555 [Gammaproteobacteria bacterium]
MRLDPSLRWAVELAARKQRRTVSGFLEWAAALALHEVEIEEKLSAKTASDKTFDALEPDRLMRLALRFPELLNHDEQVIFKFVKEMPAFWREANGRAGLNLTLVRACWELLQRVPDEQAPTPAEIAAIRRQVEKQGSAVVLAVNPDDSFSVLVIDRNVRSFTAKGEHHA